MSVDDTVGFRDRVIDFITAPPPDADPWVVKPAIAPIDVVEYDPRWPEQAQDVTARLRSALGLRALRIEHVGSTSVPGLPAKPIIDLDVTVADPADEQRWLPSLESAGFVLTVREPWFHEHRMLRGGRRADDRVAPTDGGPAANIHVFGPDSPEVVRHLVFRNWLRHSEADRRLYATTKCSAAAASTGSGAHVADYNERKQAVIRDIYARAFRATGFAD